MDSMPKESSLLLRFWRVLFGGSEAVGMTRLLVVLAAYLLVFGFLFAVLTR